MRFKYTDSRLSWTRTSDLVEGYEYTFTGRSYYGLTGVLKDFQCPGILRVNRDRLEVKFDQFIGTVNYKWIDYYKDPVKTPFYEILITDIRLSSSDV